MQSFKELTQRNFSFSLWSAEANLIDQFERNSWPAQKIFLGPTLKNGLSCLLFVASLPFLQAKLLLSLLGLKIKHQLNLIICLNSNEKIIATIPAKLLGLKVVWLETPDLDYRQFYKLTFLLYKINCRLAKVVAFNNYIKSRLICLNLASNQKKVEMILPGIKPSQYQENIFNKLAALNQVHFHRRYFTVGVIAELKQKQKIEAIFQAIKICLPVIPNLQLIIIGEGRERKNLLWLSKKMQIENLVWLVGQQEQLKKWLDSFNIFLATGDFLKLDDYGNILEAMAAGLPVLGPRNVGLEDLIEENKSGALIKTIDSEMLARQIIKLHQDKKLRSHMGKNNREQVARLFTLKQMVEGLEKVLTE
jgi:glycosyltransferase involved in cell wall biosynthesis